MAKYRGRFKVALIFLLPGLFFGLVFGWLTRWSAMDEFWYTRSDKFLLPTYKYWAGGSLSLIP